jgi:hypothetical protein
MVAAQVHEILLIERVEGGRCVPLPIVRIIALMTHY